MKDITITFEELEYGDTFICNESQDIHVKIPFVESINCNAVTLNSKKCVFIQPSQHCYYTKVE